MLAERRGLCRHSLYLDDRTYLQRFAHQLFAIIQGRIIIPAIEAFPLSQATEAHNRIESRQNMGAVVLAPEV
jgi:NADPH:quinone reductase-like Zn-dependent oxidoreductase